MLARCMTTDHAEEEDPAQCDEEIWKKHLGVLRTFMRNLRSNVTVIPDKMYHEVVNTGCQGQRHVPITFERGTTGLSVQPAAQHSQQLFAFTGARMVFHLNPREGEPQDLLTAVTLFARCMALPLGYHTVGRLLLL